jgi:phosphopantetheine--protein transferase-like protein
MIRGIGVDSVDIKRFALWHTYLQKKLLRIFSEHEIEYCLRNQHKSAERFAVRFAAKEAFFKAFSCAYPDMYIPFLTMCRYVSIQKRAKRPFLCIKELIIDATVHVSLTHTDNVATAFVIIE